MSHVLALIVGIAVGTHVATWGMYKDAIHEGFSRLKYARSIVLAMLIAPLAAVITGVDAASAPGIVVLFGITYALERSVTEFWKTFIRDEDQSKYFIPMQFHVMGRVIRNRLARLAIGVGLLAAALVLLWIAFALEPAPGSERSLWTLVLVSSLGGWYSACAGAFKDAPIEGFETLKFFRSPVAAIVFGLVVSNFTGSYPLIALAAVGFTVASLETYKTFFFPSTPRGKFAGKPVLYPRMLMRRQFFVPLYVLIWAGVLAAAVGAFAPRALWGGG